jgi:hypothetical protein
MRVRGVQAVRGAARDCPFEESCGVPRCEVRDEIAVACHRVDGLGAGNECPHDECAVCIVEAQHRERVGVAAFDDRVDGGGGQGSLHRGSLD